MDRRLGWTVAVGLGGAALGALAVAALLPEPRVPADVAGARAAPTDPAAVAELADGLRREVEARRALEARVEALQAELRRWSSAGGDDVAEPEADAGDDADRTAGADAGGRSRRDPWFDETRLEASDLAPDEVARLRERFEQHQLDLLYLRDQARREGWLGRPRFRNESAALDAQLREDVGPDAYDWMLYASGQTNRVVLAGVLGDSAAERAGLRDGDVLLRYADVDVRRPRDLLGAIAAGEAGETVPVEIRRGDQDLRVYVPRGPLGTRIQGQSLAPEPR